MNENIKNFHQQTEKISRRGFIGAAAAAAVAGAIASAR